MQHINRSIFQLFFVLIAILCCTNFCYGQNEISEEIINNQQIISSNIPATEILSDMLAKDASGNTAIGEEESPEDLDSLKKARNWWRLMWKGQLSLHDSTVYYPKFVKFCVDVYNWGDKTFNSYDTTYVVGTGRNWKARLAFDAWTDSYHINIDRKMPITLISTPYTSMGVVLHFMAVSVNYTLDLSNLCFNKPVNHKKIEFGFNCARFNLDLAFNSNTGGSNIHYFGDYKKGKIFSEYFSGVDMTSFTGDLYYFFNNRKYANGAAYNYSKIQKKSAGSLIAGLSYAYEDIKLDFTKLPEHLLPYMQVNPQDYKFNYHNYSLILGYGRNIVLNKHFLYNFTLLPAIGFLHCTEKSSEGSINLFSVNASGKMSLTYNAGDFFTCLVTKANAHWYKSDKLSTVSSIANASISVGIRF